MAYDIVTPELLDEVRDQNLPRVTCRLGWGGANLLVETDIPFLPDALQREGGGFWKTTAQSNEVQELRLTVLAAGSDPVPHEERFSAAIDPTAGWARLQLVGPYSPDEAVLVVVSYAALLLRYWLLRRYGHVLHLHAAVVVHEGRALALLGRSGAGKTTLTARMVKAGWRYLTDEDALIAGDWVHPLPRALRMSDWTAERLGIVDRTEPYQGFFQEQGRRWLCPEHHEGRSIPLAGILILSPDAHEPAHVAPVDPWSGLIDLLDQTQRENRNGDRAPPEIHQATLDYNRQLLDTLETLMHRVPVEGLYYDLDRDLDVIPNLLLEWLGHER